MTAADYIPTSTTQAKRLAVLHGPDKLWRPPLAFCLSYPGRFDVERLELALRLLARRHSGLRVYFLPDQSVDVAGCLPAGEAAWPMKVTVLSRDEESAAAEAAAAQAWLARRFDPFERPLIRALLLRRATDDVLGLAVEHSLVDGYSMMFLLADLARVYDGLQTHPESVFDTLESDAVQFARDERQWLASEAGAAALSWWDSLTAGLGAFPRARLPEAAPPDPAARDVTYAAPLSVQDVTRLRERCGELRLSTFMLAASAACVALREHGPTDDVAFLFVFARRVWPSTAKLVAYMANRSLMRISAKPDDSVASLADQVRAAMVAVIRHGMLGHDQFIRVRFPDLFDKQPVTPALHLNIIESRSRLRLGGLECAVVEVSSPADYMVPGIGVSLTINRNGTGALSSTYPQGLYDSALVANLTQTIARHCTGGAG